MAAPRSTLGQTHVRGFSQRGADGFAQRAHSHANTRQARGIASSRGLRQADEMATGGRPSAR